MKFKNKAKKVRSGGGGSVVGSLRESLLNIGRLWTLYRVTSWHSKRVDDFLASECDDVMFGGWNLSYLLTHDDLMMILGDGI